MVIAHHIILTAYGHWLPNDPRGSVSTKVSAGKLDKLGVLHSGRKPIQPPRAEVKEFYREAKSELEHPVLWFNEPHRRTIASAVETTIHANRYTCFACAVLSNHAHIIIRKHRDRAETMIQNLRADSSTAVRKSDLAPKNHPIWSTRTYKKFLFTGDDVRRTIQYVRANPAKERLPAQEYDFVTSYRNEWDQQPLKRSPTQ